MPTVKYDVGSDDSRMKRRSTSLVASWRKIAVRSNGMIRRNASAIARNRDSWVRLEITALLISRSVRKNWASTFLADDSSLSMAAGWLPATHSTTLPSASSGSSSGFATRSSSSELLPCTQRLGYRPRLRDASVRRKGRIAIEDLGDRPEPVVAEVMGQW